MASRRCFIRPASSVAILSLLLVRASAVWAGATDAGSAKVVTVGPGGKVEVKKDDAKKDEAKKDEAKTAAKPESKDAKGTEKAEAKKVEKVGEKVDEKAGQKKEEKTEAGKDAKKDEKANGKGADKAGEKKDEKPGQKAAEKPGEKKPAARAGKKSAADDEPAPPNTPPIKMSALRDEMSHPVKRDERPIPRAEREKLEQLAAEINKAREGLRQDTAKLEALMAARDAAAQAAPAPGAGPAGGDGGEPVKKTPTPLDNLAKAIRGMKPEQAAPIISRVDRKLAADVLLRMPGSDAGKVMGVCKPEVAAELAAEIASRTPHAELRR